MSLDGDSLAGVFSKVFFCRVAIKKKNKTKHCHVDYVDYINA